MAKEHRVVHNADVSSCLPTGLVRLPLPDVEDSAAVPMVCAIHVPLPAGIFNMTPDIPVLWSSRVPLSIWLET